MRFSAWTGQCESQNPLRSYVIEVKTPNPNGTLPADKSFANPIASPISLSRL
jgi:hypothetical protein